MKLVKNLSIISGIILLLAIPPMWPYGYYQLLRWVVCVTAVFGAHRSYKQEFGGWFITMVVIAILFNPIAPIHLDKGTWMLIDLVVALIMFSFSSKEK